MDKLKHNFRSSFLLLLLAMSSFSLFAQKQTVANKAITKTNNTATGTTQSNTSTINRRLILQGTTTKAHQVPEVLGRGLQVDNEVTDSEVSSSYSDNIHTTSGGDLSSNSNPTSSLASCPMMYVQVDIPFLQSCIHSSAQVNYCNQGAATAFGTYVDVEIPAELALDSADLPYTLVAVNLYRFQLGTVPVSVCNQFNVYFTTNCDSNLIGEEHCINARIYPDTLCNSVQNTPLVIVDATCVAGKAIFTLTNHGTTVTANQHMQLVIIEDHLIVGGGYPTTPILDDTLVLSSGVVSTHSFTPGYDPYKLELTDGAGSQLVISKIKNCYAGSSSVDINTLHTHQKLDQFGNGSLLPSTSQACAVNGNSAVQSNSSFAPSPSNNGTFKPNGTSNTVDNASDLELLESEETTVLVFPNPFSQYTTVRIQGPVPERFVFRLYDAMGKAVQVAEYEEQRAFQVERGNLSQGMYLYQIESEGKLIDTGKLIIK